MQLVYLYAVKFLQWPITLFGLLALVVLLLNSLLAHAGQNIKVYVYHNQPPFVLQNGDQIQAGLSVTLVEQLNLLYWPEYLFKPEIRPRMRLNHELQPWIDAQCPNSQTKCDDNWIVLWVTPQWGWGADAESRYLWVDFFQDHDYLISAQQKPIDVWSAENMQGKIFASLRGHVYPPEINQFFDSGVMLRADSDNELTLLQRIHRGRADLSLMQLSTLNYLFQHNHELSLIKNELHIANEPLKSFMLQAMIPAGRQDLKDALEQLKSQQTWIASLKEFGIQ
ncbi:hypothetical protein [Paraglaciecola hydrolytica]|uniref:Solute-binding protein family 3/N-terminal domain-containing protein n=1 Tax=Paraglaciecola hydrolytica TaxID=1799789 RepID=A0A135ZZU6_9ALTE|nr:hypothetical protein [Paraglaciecola hydrolytica]KXI28430.1 hypothetical protein AX660_15125 [Paraglaciecola hydrolytica]